MITTPNYMLPPSDINEMPQKIPDDLIGKDLIHEMTSDTHESIMKSSVLIPDNSFISFQLLPSLKDIPVERKRTRKNTPEVFTLYLAEGARCRSTCSNRNLIAVKQSLLWPSGFVIHTVIESIAQLNDFGAPS